MKINEHMLNLKSQYGEKTTNLVLPFSDRAWRLLAEFHDIVKIPVPALIERLIEDACIGEWWTQWAEWEEKYESVDTCTVSSPTLDSPEELVADLLSEGSLH